MNFRQKAQKDSHHSQRNEARFLYVRPDEVSVLAELPHADRAHGELPAQNEREQVEAFPAAVREPVREVGETFPRLSEAFVHVEDEAVHVVGRLVAVVEKMLLSGTSSVEALVKARESFLVFNAELDERGDVLHVVHALSVRAAPDHRELPARYLAQQVVDVAAVALAEDDRRADYHGGIRRVLHEPRAVFFLGKVFCPSVVVEIVDRAALVRSGGREAVDGDRAGEDYPADSEPRACVADVPTAAHVHVVVERFRRHVVAVLGGEVHHRVAPLKRLHERMHRLGFPRDFVRAGRGVCVGDALGELVLPVRRVPHVAARPPLRVCHAFALVRKPYLMPRFKKPFCEACPHKARSSDYGYGHVVLLGKKLSARLTFWQFHA